MGSWRVYETDIKTLKQQLNIFEEMYGEDTKIRLRHASTKREVMRIEL